jgi:hypothetical protein
MRVVVGERFGVRAAVFAAAGALVIALSGCSTFSGMFSDYNPDSDSPYGPPKPPVADGIAYAVPQGGTAATKGAYRNREELTQPLSAEEQAVIASARTLIGQGPESRVIVNGRTFVLDCIGTVSAIFYGMNVDVQRDFRRYRGDGVSRLYQTLRAQNVLHRDALPRPGDIIFWDNTWDANGDGSLDDDPLTHAGVVMSVDADGTIHYVHEHVIKGVVVESMNLLRPRDYYSPQGRIINNAMAMNSGISRRDNPPHWTSGDLWDSFGDILRVRKYFEVAVTVPGTDHDETVLVALRPPDRQ